MADEVTKTVENVDRLFSQIIVNGEVHESQNYVPQAEEEIIPPQIQEESSNPTPIVQPATETGQDIHAVEINDVLHDFVDPETVQNLSQEVTARQNADLAIERDVTELQGAVSTIQGKIPNQASSENQLADKNFVNSSIATNTANFLGTYTSLADIEAIQNPTNNDYAFLETTDSAGNTLYDRYKYNAEDDEWLFEYELNNSGFTAEQWATINSGITQVSDTVQSGDTNPVSSDAVYQAIQNSGNSPQGTFDYCHPVGEVCVQYPSKKDPATLYNVAGVIDSTWTEITADYDGSFFRAYKSGTSGDFVAYGESLINKMQASQNLNHNHSGNSGYSGNLSMSGGNHRHSITVNFRDVDGSTYPYTVGSSDTRTNYTGYSGSLTVSGANHRHSISAEGGSEARPNNYAIKIWERTA